MDLVQDATASPPLILVWPRDLCGHSWSFEYQIGEADGRRSAKQGKVIQCRCSLRVLVFGESGNPGKRVEHVLGQYNYEAWYESCADLIGQGGDGSFAHSPAPTAMFFKETCVTAF